MGALLAIPLVRFVTYPMRKSDTATTWSDLGPVQDFASLTAPTAKTITLERRDAWQTTSSQTAVYVLPPKNGQFPILSPICPHLGCSVRWVGAEDKFVCPCHAGRSRQPESASQDHRLAPWTHLNPKSRTAC